MNTDAAFSPYVEPDRRGPEFFPELTSLSGRFIYRFLPVPHQEPAPPEYVFVPYDVPARRRSADAELRLHNAISQWNFAWEAAQFNWQVHEKRDFPKRLRFLFDGPERNVRLVPHHADRRDRYDAYAPIYHLLPRATLERFGLPLLKRGIWPFAVSLAHKARAVPGDFDERLARAFSHHIWPLLSPRTGRGALSRGEPLVVLSHNLDFWLPYVDLVAQQRIKALGSTAPDPEDIPVLEELAAKNAGAPGVVRPPSFGGTVWLGEDEAWEATRDAAKAADRHGRLSDLIDAIRSHRVQDDFSERWSYEREDFERKLFHKRLKIKPVFVQLDDTVPVHGPTSEVHEQLLWEDFLTVVLPKDRRVVVCLRNGITSVGDISRRLGYANHSPVSKALRRIRQQARAFFSVD